MDTVFGLLSLEYLLTAIALVAIGGVLFVALRRTPQGPRTLLEKVRDVANTLVNPSDDRQDHWMLTSEQANDRRRTARRFGNPTPIRVRTSPGAEPHEGIVVDRTSRGLCFASERRYEVGNALFVLAVAAMPDIPSVAVTVRNCRERDGYFLIGCQFDHSPPWAVLLLFG